MVHANSVSVEDMIPQLLTLDTVRERLAATEPLSEVSFDAGLARIRLEDKWADKTVDLTDYTNAYLAIGQNEFQLTKQGALELGAQVGIPRAVQMDTDPDLMAQLINWRLLNRIEKKGLKALGTDNRVMAITRGTVSPFSNLALLDVMVGALRNKYGTEGDIYADYKFHHDLEHTGLRLIVPAQQRVITGTAVEGDTWSLGLDFANSLTGLKQTEIMGQLFRWWCTNGCTDTLHSVGGLSRRGTTQDDALAWAQETVETVLGGLEPMLDHVQGLTGQKVTGDVRSVLEGLFSDYAIPSRDRHRIIETMADDEEMTAYSLMQAVTMAANMDDMEDRDRQRLMRMGGSIAGSHSERCNLGRLHRVQVPANAAEGHEN